MREFNVTRESLDELAVTMPVIGFEKRFFIYLTGLFMIIFTGCQCINSKYVHEDDILYEKGKFGYYYFANKFGEIKLPKNLFNPPDNNYYKIANPFSCGLALVMFQNNEWKYINKNGDVIIDAAEYNYCWGFEELTKPGSSGLKGLAYVCKSDSDTWDFFGLSENLSTRFGLINLKGDVVLPVEYEDIVGLRNIPPYNNIWWVRKNGLYGAINEKVKFIIPLKYTEITLFEHGHALVQLNDFWGVIDKKGKTVFPFSITEFKQFGTVKFESRTLAKKGEYWGVINEKGKTVIPFIYTRWEKLNENIVKMFKEDGSHITWNFREDIYVE